MTVARGVRSRVAGPCAPGVVPARVVVLGRWMTSSGVGAMRAGTRFGGLRWRLFAPFLAVAVGAVGLLALLAAVSVDRRSDVLAEQQQTELRAQIGAALTAAYVAGSGTWRPENLAVVEALAAHGDATVVLDDGRGREVARMGPDAHGPSRGSTEPHGTGREPSNHMTGPASAPGPDGEGEGEGEGDKPATGGAHDRTWGVVAPATTSTPATTAPVASIEPAAGTTTIPIVVDGRQVGTARLTSPRLDQRTSPPPGPRCSNKSALPPSRPCCSPRPCLRWCRSGCHGRCGH